MKPAYDEMRDAFGSVRPSYQPYADWLQSTPPEVIARKREEADLTFHRVGITFAVYGEEAGKELALLYSLVVSCTRVGVNPVEYLADVLDRIDKTADDNLAELLPDRWKPPPKPAPTTDFDA